MRTIATYTVSLTPADARDLVADFLRSEQLVPESEPDWDGTALWGSCALRFGISDTSQGYRVEVHIRDLSEPGVRRCSVDLRQDACGYRGAPEGPRRSLVLIEHFDDALRREFDRHGVVERVEQFV